MSEHKATIRCWNDIGIWGNSTCPRLASAIHCANCTIYSDAGRELFEREIPQNYFKSWVEEMITNAVSTSRKGVSFFVFKGTATVVAKLGTITVTCEVTVKYRWTGYF